MSLKNIFLYVFLLMNFLQGQAQIDTSNWIQAPDSIIHKKATLTDQELQSWWQKDIINDTIPGISLEKAYQELLKDKKGQEVIVAVIDTQLDIHHEDLTNQIWINTDEIANNNIDDDKNGYVDDVHGWNFLSNKKGEHSWYELVEVARIVKKFEHLLKSVPDSLSSEYPNYLLVEKAKKELDSEIVEIKNFEVYANNWIETYEKAEHKLKAFFKTNTYTISQLDSLQKIQTNDTLVTYYAKVIKKALKNERTPQLYTDYKIRYKKYLKYLYNTEYEERNVSMDDPENLEDKYYGSPIVYGDAPFQHGTPVAGFIAANRENNLGIKGICSTVKIMPVVMVSSGDEHDKDVSLAIRYAVDNGAKIINMSWGKYYSLHEDWVKDAIQYAAEKDVLLITGAGNDTKNLDSNNVYPNDWENNNEIADNFLMIGANTHTLDKNLIASFSNYGKEQVDLFSPGNKVYATEAKNTYDFTRGTSFSSPIVSGVAALIRSYYPNLKASEVKQILIESGTSYTMDVEIEQEDGTKKLVPFSELSKSGKIVNAYNALLMAAEMTKAKK